MRTGEVRPGKINRPELPLAVVVGAGAMGAVVARRLGQRHRVLVVDIDSDRANRLASIMRDEGCDADAQACDVTSGADVARLASAVSDRGGLGVLANVTGLSPSADDFELIVNVNLAGPAKLCDALLPQTSRGSVAILVASMAAHLSMPGPDAIEILRQPTTPNLAERLKNCLGETANAGSAYSHSKYGLLMLARSLAADWGARGARIVSLSPGMIATPMGAKEFEANEAKQRMFAASPLKREGTMQEIADAVEFLSSDRASFISGTDLLVDGGLAAALTAS